MPHTKTKRVVIGLLLSITAMGAVISCAVPHAEAGDRIKVFWTQVNKADGEPNTAKSLCEISQQASNTKLTTAEQTRLKYLSGQMDICTSSPYGGCDMSEEEIKEYQVLNQRARGVGYCTGDCKPYFTNRYEEGTTDYDNQPYFCTRWLGPDDNTVTESGSWMLQILNSILSYLVEGLGYLLSMLMMLIETMMEYAFDEPDKLKTVWEAFRDFTNIVIALALVIFAVMNVMRIKMDNYAIKKSLPGVIIALIFVNLSWVICWMLMDLGNIVYEIIKNIVPGASLSGFISTEYFDSATMLYGDVDPLAANNPGIFLGLLSRLVLMFIIIVPLGQLLVAMIIRIAALWILLVISPLAWIGYAIPDARAATWSRYWTQLITMVFMPAKVMVFFVIAVGLVAVISGLTPLANGDVFPDSALPIGASQVGAGHATLLETVLLTVAAAVLIKMAAREGLKSDFAEVAMTWGGKVGKMLTTGLTMGVGKWGPKVAKDATRTWAKDTYGRAVTGQSTGMVSSAIKLASKPVRALQGMEAARKETEARADDMIKSSVRTEQDAINKRRFQSSAHREIRRDNPELAADLAAEHEVINRIQSFHGKPEFEHSDQMVARLDVEIRNKQRQEEVLREGGSPKADQFRREIDYLQRVRDQLNAIDPADTHALTKAIDGLEKDHDNKLIRHGAQGKDALLYFGKSASAQARLDAEGMKDAQERLGGLSNDDAVALLKDQLTAAINDPKLLEDTKYDFRVLFQKAAENGDFHNALSIIDREVADDRQRERIKEAIWGERAGLAIGGLETKDYTTMSTVLKDKNRSQLQKGRAKMLEKIMADIQAIHAGEGNVEEKARRIEQRVDQDRTALRAFDNALAQIGDWGDIYGNTLAELENMAGGDAQAAGRYVEAFKVGEYEKGYDAALSQLRTTSAEADKKQGESLYQEELASRNQSHKEVDGAIAKFGELIMGHMRDAHGNWKQVEDLSVDDRRMIRAYFDRLTETAGAMQAANWNKDENEYLDEKGLSAVSNLLEGMNFKLLVNALGETGATDKDKFDQFYQGRMNVGTRSRTKNFVRKISLADLTPADQANLNQLRQEGRILEGEGGVLKKVVLGTDVNELSKNLRIQKAQGQDLNLAAAAQGAGANLNDAIKDSVEQLGKLEIETNLALMKNQTEFVALLEGLIGQAAAVRQQAGNTEDMDNFLTRIGRAQRDPQFLQGNVPDRVRKVLNDFYAAFRNEGQEREADADFELP